MEREAHAHTRTGKLGLIVVTCLLLAGFCFGQPAVSLSPKDGPPTTNLQVSGSGFTPYAQIDIYFDSQDQAVAMADATGTFRQIAIQAPKFAVPGNHWVTAAERSGRIVKQEIFEVHVNWTEFHTKDMMRWNPYENILNVNNVGSLQELWSYQTGDAIYSSPSVVNGVVYVGSRDHHLYALKARTGALLGRLRVGYLDSSPAVVDGAVYFGSWGDWNVYALDAHTGAPLWSYKTGDHVDSSPAVANGAVYVGSDDDNIYALDARTGALLWSFQTGLGVDVSPAVANGVVYVGGANFFYALDARTGAKLWSYQTESFGWSSPAVANGVVYVGSYEGTVYALDASTGHLLWTYFILYPVDSSPAVANGVVYFGSRDHNVYALDASTGAKLWKYTTAGEVESSPAVANGMVYVGSYDTVYGLNARNGHLLWSYQTGFIYSSPSVLNGVVYIGSEDGSVYAFGLPGGMMPQPPKRPDPKTLRPDFILKPVSTAVSN